MPCLEIGIDLIHVLNPPHPSLWLCKLRLQGEDRGNLLDRTFFFIVYSCLEVGSSSAKWIGCLCGHLQVIFQNSCSSKICFKVTSVFVLELQLSFWMVTDACILPNTTYFDMVVDTFFLVNKAFNKMQSCAEILYGCLAVHARSR